MASIAYAVSTAFLLESMLQWLIFELLNVSGVLFGNYEACLVILIISVVAILMYRFVDCRSMPVWMRMLLALTVVQLAIFGAGGVIMFTTSLEIVICFLLIVLVFVILSFVGCHMMTVDTTLFVAWLCLCTFCGLIGFVLILTLLLAIQWEVTYMKVFIMCIYPALFFNVAYDSREINSPANKSLSSLEDNLHYGLYLYGEFIVLLVITLKLVEQ